MWWGHHEEHQEHEEWGRRGIRVPRDHESLWPGRWSASMNGHSDHRCDVSFGAGGGLNRGDADSQDSWSAWFDVGYRPTHAMRLSFGPSYSHNQQEMQYVDTASWGDEERYVFASLNQKTLSITFRIDLSITPDLTVQLYASPFLSTGRFDEFKRITDPNARRSWCCRATLR